MLDRRLWFCITTVLLDCIDNVPHSTLQWPRCGSSRKSVDRDAVQPHYELTYVVTRCEQKTPVPRKQNIPVLQPVSRRAGTLRRPFRPSQLGVTDFFRTTSIRLTGGPSIIFVLAPMQYDQTPAKQEPIYLHNAHPAPSSNRPYSLLIPYQCQSQAAVTLVEDTP